MRKLICTVAILASPFVHPTSAGAFRWGEGWTWPAPAQTITVVNRAHVSQKALRKVERAIVAQSWQLRRYWHTPVVRFGRGGWVLDLTARQDAEDLALDPASHSVYGYHADRYFVTADGSQGAVPIIQVAGVNPPWATGNLNCDAAGNRCQPMSDPWSVTLSHEVLETLANPTGRGREVCDPVGIGSYRLRGVWVSDFATPRWFTPRSSGPWDQMHTLARAGEAWGLS